MISDGDETRSQRQGLGGVGDGREFGPESLPQQLVRQLRGRWKILGSIVVTAVTTAAIYRVDETISKDVIVFAVLTVGLLVYALLTIRSDLELE